MGTFVVSGSILLPFVDAFQDRLQADTQLAALVTGIFGHLKQSQRQAYPYLVLGRRGKNDAGAMTVAGGIVSLQVDGWSNHQGASEIEIILGHVSRVMERQSFVVPGYEMVRGSLTCDFEDVFDEPDPDTPTRDLYHGVQRWLCELHESS